MPVAHSVAAALIVRLPARIAGHERLAGFAAAILFGLLDRGWLGLLRRYCPSARDDAGGYSVRLQFHAADDIFVRPWQGMVHLLLVVTCLAAFVFAIVHIRKRRPA